MKKTWVKYSIIIGSCLAVLAAVLVIVLSNQDNVAPNVADNNMIDNSSETLEVNQSETESSEHNETSSKNTVVSENNASTTENQNSSVTPESNKETSSTNAPNKDNNSSALDPNKAPVLVRVPNIAGKSLEDATKTLSDMGLKIKTDIKCSDTVKEGYVVSQDTKAGVMVSPNSTVIAYISVGAANTIGNTPSNSSQMGYVAAQGDWIYYCNIGADYKLYKMRSDGSEKQRLTKNTANAINVVGEWIYYAADDGLYKIRIDGSQNTKISSDKYSFLHVVDEWIYASKQPSGKIYRMKTDGTEKSEICSDICSDINIVGDWIYYIRAADCSIYKIRTDGSEKTKFFHDLSCNHISASDNTLFFTADMYIIARISTDGSGYYSVSEKNKEAKHPNAYDGWVYYRELDFVSQKTVFYKAKYDLGEKTKILEQDGFKNPPNSFINVVDEWLYFNNPEDNDYLYRIKTDGTNLQKIAG